MKHHFCDQRLLPGECIRCIGAPRPTVLFDTWAGTVRVPCELLKRTPKRMKVRFLTTALSGPKRIQPGDVRYVPIRSVRDGDGQPISEVAP